AGAVEEKFAPEVLDEGTFAAEPVAAAAAAVAPVSDAAASVFVDAATVAEGAEPPVIDGGELAADASAALVLAPSSTPTAKASPHKRHWRPRRLALGFAPGESVSVTRRLYRDGESEYLLNGRTCRLRDIQDLFSGTGLSGAHYAIVEQGRIGQILSAKPMDRRNLIEEAAGITKFRVRQRAAEARLEGARSNLRRVSDIISEIERQVGSLRRQAAKARRYRQLREELRGLMRRVYAAEEHALTSLLAELRATLAAVGEEERSLVSGLEEREDESRRATSEARGREEELASARAAVADAALRRDRRERERAYQQEQSVALDRRIADVGVQTEHLRERLSRVLEESEQLREADAQLRAESEKSARQLQEVEAVYARRVADMSGAEQQIERARAELLTHTAVTERLMETGRQLDATLERLASQAEGYEREGERARQTHEELIVRAGALGEEIAQMRASLDARLAERGAAGEGVAAARSLVSATLAEYARMREEAARVRNRLDTLAELDNKRALYSQAVQRLFSAEQAADADEAQNFHSVGTLADLLRVEPQYERAVESVLGAYLQTIVVPTPDDAVRAAAWLNANNAGRANFLVAGLRGASADGPDPRRRMSGSTDGIEGETEIRLGEVLGAPPEIGSVLGRTLAREMDARIALNLDHAMMRSLDTGAMYVTLEGEWVAGGQLVGAAGGHAAASAEDGAGLLAFKREMRELEARAADLASEVVSAEDSVSAARARLVELEDQLLLLNEMIGREEREQVTREMTAAQLAQEIERAARHVRVVTEDAARLGEEINEVRTRRERQAIDAEAAGAAREAAAREVAEAGEQLAAAR
ncbi:MAG: hypothetical protein ACRD9R_21380, partial [Pyrinomonadaceae bacterium]